MTVLVNRFQGLATLSASSNDFRSLKSPIESDTLVSLHLEENFFNSLSSISPLSKLRNLKSLYLRNNSISQVYDCTAPLSSDGKLEFPQSLEYVDLSYNAIGAWSFVNDLQTVFPGLTGLRISHNPLFEDASKNDGKLLTVDESYMLTLARLANLSTLNFSNVRTASLLRVLPRLTPDMRLDLLERA